MENMKEENKEPFEELFIPRKDLHLSSAMVYRVYRDNRHYELVEAASALDAMAACKNKKIYKIQRHDPLGFNVIHLNQVLNQDFIGDIEPDSKSEYSEPSALPQEPVEAAPAKIASEPPAPPPAPPAAEAPAESRALSNEEIDKLLNG